MPDFFSAEAVSTNARSYDHSFARRDLIEVKVRRFCRFFHAPEAQLAQTSRSRFFQQQDGPIGSHGCARVESCFTSGTCALRLDPGEDPVDAHFCSSSSAETRRPVRSPYSSGSDRSRSRATCSNSARSIRCSRSRRIYATRFRTQPARRLRFGNLALSTESSFTGLPHAASRDQPSPNPIAATCTLTCVKYRVARSVRRPC